MPNEPCENDTCIDRTELEGLHERLAEAEAKVNYYESTVCFDTMLWAVKTLAGRATCKAIDPEKVADIVASRDSLRSQLAEAEAANVAMRDVAERLKGLAEHQLRVGPYIILPEGWQQILDRCTAALSSQAGRDMAERLERAEDFLHEIDTDQDGISLGFTLHAIGQYLKEMDGTIAASEAQKQREEMLGLLREAWQHLRCGQIACDSTYNCWQGCGKRKAREAIDAYLKRGGKDA